MSVLAKIYTPEMFDFTIQEVGDRIEPKNILMSTPDYFDIIDVKNVHMEGNADKLNKPEAWKQWMDLKKCFDLLQVQGLLDQVRIIAGAPQLEDMVFTANQSFPWVLPNGEKVVIMSKMRHESRKKEVPYFEKYYNSIGYRPIHLQKTMLFEGMGDLIPHTGKNLLYGGYGHRSGIEAYDEISQLLQVPIVALELIDERFYHLDTCFVSLGTDAVMICEEAFTSSGIEVLEKLYQRVYKIPVSEAISAFALNAHTIFDLKSGKRAAVIHQGATFTNQVLKNEGFDVYEVNTSEYMKSGGSVFCMKMMVY